MLGAAHLWDQLGLQWEAAAAGGSRRLWREPKPCRKTPQNFFLPVTPLRSLAVLLPAPPGSGGCEGMVLKWALSGG